MKRKHWLILAAFVQVIMIFIAYKPFILHPSEFIFDNRYDGLKSLFCWYSYIFYDLPKDAFHYSILNYPFGEYVFYPDNTPIFCIILRFIQNLHIVDLQPYAFAIHHYLFLSGFLVSCILLFLILENILKSYWLIFVGAVALPWINPQFIRIEFHFNLAYSWILLLQILLTIKQCRAIISGNMKAWRKILIWQGFILFLMPLFHMYYLAINYAFLGGFWFFYWLVVRDRKTFRIFAINILVYTLSAVTFILFLQHSDKFYNLRSDTSQGYDWLNWKWRLEDLFFRNPWFKIPFVYNYKIDLGYETFAYLGSFALYGAFLIPLFFYLKKKYTLIIPPYIWALFFSGLLMLDISLGVNCVIGAKDHHFTNYLNPFYFMRMIAEKITNFRCLSRFGWYFFWTFNLSILFIADQLWQKTTNKILQFGIITLSLCLLVDGLTTVQWSDRKRDVNLFTNADEMADMKEMFKDVDVSKYQAILPIPYFHGMCDDFDYTMDPDDIQCVMAFQASYLTHLPLMACKIPRVPVPHAKALLEMVAYSKVDPSIAKLLNEKPILVLINDDRYINGYKPTDPECRHLYDLQKNFVDNNPQIVLKKYKNYRLMEWHWQNNR